MYRVQCLKKALRQTKLSGLNFCIRKKCPLDPWSNQPGKIIILTASLFLKVFILNLVSQRLVNLKTNIRWPYSYLFLLNLLFQNLSTDKAEKGSGMGDIDASGVTVPNDTWTVESLKLHKKLTSDLIEHGNGNWSKHKSSLYNGERRLFTKAMVTEYPGKFFEYEFFFSTKDQRLKGVIQFGPYTQGPPG